MKPVEQTIRGEGKGNCLAACFASILEIDIDEVGYRIDSEHWYDNLNAWLAEYNLYLVQWEYQDGSWIPPGYMILSVDSPRGDWLHGVVMHDGEIVWDPSPDRHQGVGTWRHLYAFQVLDPSRIPREKAVEAIRER